MVNTLRITSIVAVVVAGLVLLLVVGPKAVVPKLLAGFALRTDEDTQRVLDEPSAVEQWQASHGNRKVVDSDKPLLIQQAELLSKIIDPDPIPEKNDGANHIAKRPPRDVVTPPPTSAKFDLVGTSYEAANPQGSFAYIRIQGDNTYQWVQVGDEIGHYQIKEVKPDSVVCWDGRADVELPVIPPVDTASLLEEGRGGAAVETGAPQEVEPAALRITGRPVSQPWKRDAPLAGAGTETLRERSESDERARELVTRMRESGVMDPGSRPEERAARVKRLMAEFKSSQVGPKETEKVEDLGRQLNSTN